MFCDVSKNNILLSIKPQKQQQMPIEQQTHANNEGCNCSFAQPLNYYWANS